MKHLRCGEGQEGGAEPLTTFNSHPVSLVLHSAPSSPKTHLFASSGKIYTLMEGCTTRGLWLFILLLGCRRLSAFNLDTENVLQRNGDPGSLFGFSLAMHQQLRPEDKRILLVGAPQAKALNNQKSKVTGGLYKCEISPKPSDCQRIMFDNDENLSIEKKENQWMGVSVSSQGPGGKILTCAHRYQELKSQTRNILGRCYVLSQDVTLKKSMEDGVEDGGNWHFCKGRNPGHQLFGSCQQGVSVAFDMEHRYFIFGAPGAYDWKGLVRMEQRNDTLFDLGLYDEVPLETGGEKAKRPSDVPTPDNSYLGFSMAVGQALTNKGQLTVVAGAPRTNFTGAVILLKKGSTARGDMLAEFTLEGEGLSSSFGYDLTVLDLNKDGWDDIVVGAPQYFEKDSEIGGAVYVYINKAGKWNEVKPTRIDGPADSMFGLAVENLGDINQDGYHDFAVGAPYEDNGAGKVYIFHGSATGGFRKKATQVLSSKSGVRQFGYSLAGNMDLDKNSYPDLAVGSLSDSVFIYKTRPVVSIEKDITITPKKIDLTKKNCPEGVCLKVEACFRYTAGAQSSSTPLRMEYNFEVDADRKKNNLEPRGAFTDLENLSAGTITMDAKEPQKCVTRTLVMKDNIKDKLRGLPIDVSVNIQNAKRKRRQAQVAQLAPVLDPKDVEPFRSNVAFLKDGCGDDDVCASNLMLEYRYVYKDGDNVHSLEMENGVPVISLSGQKSAALEVTVTNSKGEDAYEAFVVANFPRSVTYAAYIPNAGQVSCKPNQNGSKVDCDVGNPFKRDSKTTFYILFDITNTTEVEIELKLKTTSTQQNLANVKAKAKVAITLTLSLSGQVEPSQVYYNGEAKRVTDVKAESDIGPAIKHWFTIINRGKRLKDIGQATLYIEWPKMTDKNNHLLYLMTISSTGLKEIKCFPKEEINHLGKKSVNRKRRDITKGINGTISFFTGEKKHETLSCGSGAKCVTMKCLLGDFDYKATITLSSRLWNNTFVGEYSDFNYVDVMVKASLHVNSSTKITMEEGAETQVRLSVFPERRSARYGGVAWWIIFLSILLLLLLLALLAFLLWKCGVFKKNKEGSSDKEKLTSNT
ncbi:integrin alpha-6-like isoform X1 [Xiphophorus hellerii]|uniref:integrin alpha-6-like isoform X1 n=1 Tax=Xiphophorus hellerii TaxID=8084 RepID=UPI0013B426F5|nr:integrin alpha-6-like isoform X1 [Xiphophorus hellerii]